MKVVASIQHTLVFLILLIGFDLSGQSKIEANDSKLQYQGRIDFKNEYAPVFIWPGTSVKFKFKGTKVSAILTDHAASSNYFAVLIDGKVGVLKLNRSDTVYVLASNLTDSVHSVVLFKRTEAMVGTSTFGGFVFKGKALLPDALPERKIEIIGDSWSCGYGNEMSYPNPNCCPGFHAENEDNYAAYGALLSRQFNTQYMCTAYSGRGMYTNYEGSTKGVLPELYTQLYPDQKNEVWNPKSNSADLLLVFLGTNDFAKEVGGVVMDAMAYVSAYISFVEKLRSFHAHSTILMVYGGSVTDGYPVGKHWLSRWKKDMAAVQTYFANDGKVLSFELSAQQAPYGEDWHPTKVTQSSIAEQLSPVIKSAMGW